MNADLICHRLLSAFINGGYQGLLLTGLIALGLRLFSRANAATRHAVWFVALLMVAALPVVHFFFAARGGLESENAETSVGEGQEMLEQRGEPGSKDAGETAGSGGLATGDYQGNPFLRTVDRERIPGPLADFEVDTTGSDFLFVPEIGAADPQAGVEPLLVDSVDPELPAIPDGVTENSLANRGGPVHPHGPGEGRAVVNSAGWRLGLPPGVGVSLVGLWLVLALVRLSVLGGQCFRLQRLKRQADPASREWQTLLAALGAEMGLRRKVRLLVGYGEGAPMVVGFWRPAVVLPSGMFDDASEAEVQQILRHELGHLIRGDDWWNLVQQIVRAVLFFHPAVWWLSRRLTLEREFACDDHVLAAISAPRAYALFLTEFAGRMQCRDLAAAPAAWNNQTQLKERVAMILDSKRNSSPRLGGASAGVLMAATALLAGLVVQAGPRLALAAENPVNPPIEALGASPDGDNSIPPPPIVEIEEIPVPVAVSLATPGDVAVIQSGAVATIVTAPTPHPKPHPRVAVAVTVPPTEPAEPTPPVPVRVGPIPAALPVPPRPYALNSSDKETSGSSSSSSSSGKHVRKDSDDDSVERRLDRLEKLVEELLAREKGRRSETAGEMSFKLDQHFSKEKLAKLNEAAEKLAEKAGKAGLSETEINRIQEQAQREAERAVRDVEKAARESKRAAEAATAEAGRNLPNQPERGKKQLEIQRHVLESQQRALEKQIQVIEKQINQLEEAQERIREHGEQNRNDSDGDNDSDDSHNGPKKKVAK